MASISSSSSTASSSSSPTGTSGAGTEKHTCGLNVNLFTAISSAQIEKLKNQEILASVRHSNKDDDDDEPLNVLFREVQLQNNNAIFCLTGFEPIEVEMLWSRVCGVYPVHCKGRRPRINNFDSFFLLLNFLHVYLQANKLATLFGITEGTYHETVHKSLKIVGPLLTALYLKPMSFQSLLESNALNAKFPQAMMIIDGRFQESYRPVGRFNEAKRYFSGKHWDYGLKTTVGIYPNGRAVFVTKHDPGSVHGKIQITSSENLALILGLIRKRPEDAQYDCHDPDAALKSPKNWAVLGDKAYIGCDSSFRVICPSKPSKNHPLTLEEKALNQKISSERILIENYFGRLVSKFAVMKELYRGDHNLYDDLCHVCHALTNYHISLHPLRQADGNLYASFQTQLEERRSIRRNKNDKKDPESKAIEEEEKGQS